MKAAIKAGLFYFVLIFAAALVMGQIRMRLVEPNLGAAAGLAIELPALVLLAWVFCRLLVRGFRVPARSPERLAMGVTALALLLAAQALVALIGLGRSPAELLASSYGPNSVIRLAVQLLFAFMPWLRMKYTMARRAAGNGDQ